MYLFLFLFLLFLTLICFSCEVTNRDHFENYNILIDKLNGYLEYQNKFIDELKKPINKDFFNYYNKYNNDIKYNDIIIYQLPKNTNSEYICPTINGEPYHCMTSSNIYNTNISSENNVTDEYNNGLNLNKSDSRSWFGNNDINKGY